MVVILRTARRTEPMPILPYRLQFYLLVYPYPSIHKQLNNPCNVQSPNSPSSNHFPCISTKDNYININNFKNLSKKMIYR